MPGSDRRWEFTEPFARVSVPEAKRLIQHVSATIVDVRPAAEYARAHIPGAINIGVDDLYQHQGNSLRLEDHILLVCRIGVVSVLAAETLAAFGATHLYNLEGGMAEWVRHGYPVQTAVEADGAATPEVRQPRLQ